MDLAMGPEEVRRATGSGAATGGGSATGRGAGVEWSRLSEDEVLTEEVQNLMAIAGDKKGWRSKLGTPSGRSFLVRPKHVMYGQIGNAAGAADGSHGECVRLDVQEGYAGLRWGGITHPGV